MKRKPHTNFARTALVHGFAGTLLAISAPNVIAQEVNDAIQKRKQEQELEVIEVTGVRASLENALNVKREAPSIVDAISATDIDALPALDLGEALQALPGIQLNSETEGRQSTISLRGLSSGFVKTTAFGQSFATPSPAGGNRVGAPNPFSAFEAGIFDGVTVVKSPTADLQEGGIAGVVDKKLQQALSKKDGIASVSLGVRYEELPQSYNPNVKFSGVKHLIEDKLGVAVKFSHSRQNFRRDTFDIIDYTSAETHPTHGERATNIAEYREKWNLPDDAQVRVPQKAKNVHQFSDGDRFSLAGNIEYRVNDDMKVGAHLLVSERKLDDGTKEVTNFETGLHRTNARNDYYLGEVTLDMDVAPFAYTPLNADGTGGEAYIAPAVFFNNGQLQNENRKTTFEEKTHGLMLYGDYLADDWVFDGKVTYSKASNKFTNIGVGYRHQGNRNTSQTPTGFNGYINTGGGDLNQIRVEGALEVPYVYDGLGWNQPTIGANSISVLDEKNQGRRLNTYLNGRTRDLLSDMKTAEFNAQRYTDFGIGDVLRIDSIKTGARYSAETIESIDQVNGLGGIDLTNFDGSTRSSEEVLSAHQTPFFNGKIPGTFDHTNGWVTLNNDATIAQLQQGIVTDPSQLLLPSNIPALHESLMMNRAGFWDRARANTGAAWLLDYNYDVKQELTAAYVMADFSGDLPLDVTYRGNVGVRYVETANTFYGTLLGTDDSGSFIGTPYTFKDTYNNTLPMANISFELTEDIILRTAYSKGIVRPNVNSQRPAPNINKGARTVTLNLPNATLKPYDATNYDVSLEWYNREGSAISVGYFKKDISDLFDNQEGYCPDDGSDPVVNELIGDIRRTGASDLEFVCEEVATTIIDLDGEGNTEEVNREVRIRAPINVEDELSVEGFELAVQQKLDFLPYPWNGFGGVFNFTKIRQSGSDTLLSRVSPKSFNLITYWENDGISLRFAYNWRDDQNTAGANSFLGTGTRTIKAKGRLDFSGSYKLNKKTKLFFQAFNLTDEVITSHYGYDARAIHQLSYSGRQYKVTVNYRF